MLSFMYISSWLPWILDPQAMQFDPSFLFLQYLQQTVLEVPFVVSGHRCQIKVIVSI